MWVFCFDFCSNWDLIFSVIEAYMGSLWLRDLKRSSVISVFKRKICKVYHTRETFFWYNSITRVSCENIAPIKWPLQYFKVLLPQKRGICMRRNIVRLRDSSEHAACCKIVNEVFRWKLREDYEKINFHEVLKSHFTQETFWGWNNILLKIKWSPLTQTSGHFFFKHLETSTPLRKKMSKYPRKKSKCIFRNLRVLQNVIGTHFE